MLNARLHPDHRARVEHIDLRRYRKQVQLRRRLQRSVVRFRSRGSGHSDSHSEVAENTVDDGSIAALIIAVGDADADSRACIFRNARRPGVSTTAH
jgi:hypothetical protein